MKILECNSRPGDPEIQNLLPILKDDFVDVCLHMIEGNLTHVAFGRQATVVAYKVPPTYGGRVNEFTGDLKVDLSDAYKLKEEYEGKMQIYSGSMELRDGGTYALTSRTVCVVGIGDDIEGARNISLEGLGAIKGSLWNRWDIASRTHVERSIEHMRMLRR